MTKGTIITLVIFTLIIGCAIFLSVKNKRKNRCKSGCNYCIYSESCQKSGRNDA